MPVEQLDGGHMAYGLLGRRWAVRVGMAAFMGMAALGLTVWPGLLSWAREERSSRPRTEVQGREPRAEIREPI